MISAEERSLIPLVSRRGCFDLGRLRRALHRVKTLRGTPNFEKLLVYYYFKTDEDEVMFDNLSPILL